MPVIKKCRCSLWLFFWLVVGATMRCQETVLAFQLETNVRIPSTSWDNSRVLSPFALWMAKATKKKKQKGGKAGGGRSGLKGFGAVVPSSASSSSSIFEMDRSKQAREFYDYLEKGGAGDNLHRCGLGYFPLEGVEGAKLRGVAALKDIKKGDVIIRIPYELAVNLGPEGGDPTLPGVTLLHDYCQTLAPSGDNTQNGKRPYFQMLPPFLGDDCSGSTDFFSDDALNAIKAPLIVDETLKRKQLTKMRFDSDVATDDAFPKWIENDEDVTAQHLQWAVWLITSRILTVQGDADEGQSYRLLIPFLDMCNHDRSSPHILTGRAVPGGELKVVAGATVKAGDQINICYGGGMAGNDRFLQDYGFLDTSSNNMAFDMVAQQILGKRRILEGAGSGRLMSSIDQEKTLSELRSTTMEEDQAALESSSDLDMRFAIQYRMGVKKALSKFGAME